MKVGRNDSCPCGSGKKYKKCCLLVEEAALRVNPIESYDPIEVIKVLALLQLVPENHGKNLRIEIALAEVMNLYKSSGAVSYIQPNSLDIIKTLNKKFPRDYREDPAENSFTDNIMFGGQNNIVFPGILEEGPEVVQTLLDAIYTMENNLPVQFKNEVYAGVMFLFDVHQIICDELGYGRYEFKDHTMKELHFVEGLDFDQRNLVEFTLEEIDEIAKRYDQDAQIINHFTTDHKKFKYDPKDINSNELLYKPFIYNESRNTYILAIPSAELIAVNHYILRKAEEHNCSNELVAIYKRTIYSGFLNILNGLNFQLTDIGLSDRDCFDDPYISVFQFDTNKFALVALCDNMGSGTKEDMGRITFPKEEIVKTIDQINSVAPDYKIHLIVVPSKIDSMTGYTYLNDMFRGVDQFTMMSRLDIKVIKSLWKCDQLSLWKYQKAKDRAERKMHIMPGFKNMTYFQWYNKNYESFFHSDDYYDGISFDYNQQGDLIRQMNLTLDLHIAPIIYNEKIRAATVQLKDVDMQIYSLLTPHPDRASLLLQAFDSPIWVSCSREYYPLGEGFLGAILYWLLEMDSLIALPLNLLAPYPINIEIDFDPKYLTDEDAIPDEIETLKCALNSDQRTIKVYIPLSFSLKIKSLHDNSAETMLMEAILIGIFELIKEKTTQIFYSDAEILSFVRSILSNPDQRMLIPIAKNHNVQMNPTGIVGTRQVQESDVSVIRENILLWAGVKELNHIKTKKDKTNFCNQMVAVLIDQFRSFVKNFNYLSLLELSMIRHESLIFTSTVSEESLGPKMNCFSKYQNVVEEFRKESSRNVNSVLAYRCMIELIMAEPPVGNTLVNSDDLDYLHALTEQIVSFGNLSDIINEEFSTGEINKLPSGRIGIDHDFFNNELQEFSKSYLNNEISDKFSKTPFYASSEIDENYQNEIDETFKKEWGIGLFQISEICMFISLYTIYEKKKSFMILSEDEFISLLCEKSPFSENEVKAFCDHMTLKSRGNINRLPEGSEYRQEEIYLWRYNRQISYIRRPLLEVQDSEGKKSFVWSPRHIDMAADNIKALFSHGTLKVHNKHKGIQSLLAKRNNINGKNFRSKVYHWLAENTDLKVIPHEVPISPKHPLKSETNLGDIDIMAVDYDNKIVLLLELKNTKQAKNTYDFKRDIENYLVSLIPKHDKRVKWLQENKELLGKYLEIDIIEFELLSCIISSATLPLKYMDKSPMPIYAFSELKSKGIAILSEELSFDTKSSAQNTKH